MKQISLLLILQFSSVLWGQGQLASGTASTNGVGLSYETRLEPATPPILRFGGGVLTEGRLIKRHLCDFDHKTYFGYDLTMEPIGDGKYRLSFAPLTITPQKMEEIFPKIHGWTMSLLPQNPATQVLGTGDTLALDLFVNPSTGQKIVEYIRIQGDVGRALSATGPARDFAVDQASLELSAPLLSINGRPFNKPSHGGMSGTPIWIYAAGYGRFIFSLVPRADLGLQKAGEIRGSTMTWRWGNDEFSLNSDRRIGPGEGAYNVYVWNDPNYRPKGEHDGTELVLGAGGTLESLVKR